jgi:hypothetical protein
VGSGEELAVEQEARRTRHAQPLALGGLRGEATATLASVAVGETTVFTVSQVPLKVGVNVLTARIVADTKRMQVESPTDQSRMVEMNIQVLVTWADRGGAVLATGAVPLPAASVDVGQAAVLVPEYGRSVVSTQQEGIVKMAQQIVGLMEEPW